MKKTILTTLFLSVAITGCKKQQDEDPKLNHLARLNLKSQMP